MVFSKTDSGKFALGWNVGKQNALEQVGKDESALANLLAQIDGGTDKESVFAATMRDASAAAKEFGKEATLTEINIKSFAASQRAAAQSSTFFAKAGQVVVASIKSISLALLNMAVVTGAMWVIQKIGEAISNHIHRTQILRDEMNELIDDYEDIQSRIKEINSEIDTTNKRISELTRKDTLTFVEEKELARLREANRLLEIKRDFEEASALKNRQELAKNAGKQYRDLGTKDKWKTWQSNTVLAVMGGTLDTNEIAARLVDPEIAIREEIEHLNNLKEDLSKATDAAVIESLESEITRLEAKLSETANTLSSVRENIGSLHESQRNEEQKNIYDSSWPLIDDIQKSLNEDKWLEWKMEDIFDEEEFNGVHEALKALAEEGELTAEVLNQAEYSELISRFGEVGISAEELEVKLNSLYATAGADDGDVGDQFKSATDAFATFTKAQEAAYSAMENQGASGLSSSAYADLVENAKEYIAAIDTSSGVMSLNADKVREITLAKLDEMSATTNVNRALTMQKYTQTARQIKAYEAQIADLNETTDDHLASLGLTQEARDDHVRLLNAEMSSLLQNQSALREEMYGFDALAGEIEYATGAYKRWLDAQNAPTSADVYDDLTNVVKTIEDGLETGRVGTDAFKSAIAMLIPEGIDPTDWAAVEEYIGKFKEYLTENYDGLEQFTNDLFSEGVLEKLADGSLQFADDATIEKIAEKLNITEDVAKYLVAALQSYGWDIEIESSALSDTITEIDTATTTLADAKKRLAELGNDPNATPDQILNAEHAVTQAQALLDALSGTPELTLVQELEAELAAVNSLLETTKAIGIPAELVFHTQDEANSLQGQIDALTDAEGLIAECTVTGNTQPLEDALLAIQTPAEGTDNYELKYEVSAYLGEAYADTIDSINAEKESLGDEVSYSVTTSSVTEASSQIQTLHDNIEKVEKLKTDGLDIIQEDVAADLTGNWQSEIDALKKEIEYLENLPPIDIEVNVPDEAPPVYDPHEFSGTSGKFPEPKSGPKSTDDLVSEMQALYGSISDVNDSVDQTAEKEVGTLGLWKTTDIMADVVAGLTKVEQFKIEDKTFNVTASYGSSTPSSGSNSSDSSGTVQAKGTKRAKPGDAIVGEQGREVIISGSGYEIVGENGPVMRTLRAGDQVLNNEQTEKILRTKRASFTGDALARGAFVPPKGKRKEEQDILEGDKKAGNTGVSGSGGGNMPSSSGDDGKSGGGKSGSSSSKSGKSAFDWIEILLTNLRNTTEKLIKDAQKAIGFVRQNAKIDKAMDSIQGEIGQSEKAYDRYMKQANQSAKKSGLSKSMISKIQDGSIDISSYDDKTQQKIKEYQEWYNKAQDVKDAIEDLKEEQEELAKTKLDNIMKHYENRTTRSDSKISTSQSAIDLKNATGQEVTADDYTDIMKQSKSKLNSLSQQRQAMQEEFDKLVASGAIKSGSDAWYEYINQMDNLDQSINQTKIDMQGFRDEVSQINFTNLQYQLDALKGAAQTMQDFASLRAAQGKDPMSKEYDGLIENSKKQVDVMKQQREELLKQQSGLDKNSEKYQQLESQIREYENAILQAKVSQEQWHDSLTDLKIQDLQKQREQMERSNDEYQRQLDLQQAIEDLEKAKQKRKRVFVEGQGYVYQQDDDAVREAQQKVDDLKYQESLNKIDEEIRQLEESKKTDNIYDGKGREQEPKPEKSPDKDTAATTKAKEDVKLNNASSTDKLQKNPSVDGAVSKTPIAETDKIVDIGSLVDMSSSINASTALSKTAGQMASQERVYNATQNTAASVPKGITIGEVTMNQVDNTQEFFTQLNRDLQNASVQVSYKK